MSRLHPGVAASTEASELQTSAVVLGGDETGPSTTRLQILAQNPGRIHQVEHANAGLQYSYGVDYGALRWIYFLDPPRAL